MLISTFFFTLQITYAQQDAQEAVKKHYDIILFNTGKLMEGIHYKPLNIDDAFSDQIFLKTFENLDPQKRFFLQSDLADLEAYRLLLDDEILSGKALFFKAVHQTLQKRIAEADSMCTLILSTPFQFDKPGFYDETANKLAFPNTAEEKQERWFLYLKYMALSRYEDMVTEQLKSATLQEADSFEVKSRENLSKILERYYKNLFDKTKEVAVFSAYINTIIKIYDPHSAYYLPVSRREFVEDLSGVYYGIGALLEEKNGVIRIGELMIGGPAWHSQQIEKGDIIIKVAQDDNKAVSVEGFAMADLVKLTRGKKDSRVTITFRKADGSLKEVALMRTALHLDDTFLKTAVIEDGNQKKGYIFLPKFYTSFGDENGRSCADDMEKALIQLESLGVNGVVVDIRNNGGGSLGEVIDMVGLFVENGPVVQVKGRNNRPEVGRMNRAKVYDGPLVVLVNELSASASEIFAGAIQDYQRGVIVGSSTYGKGTVQRSFRVPGTNWNEAPVDDLGTINITIQKYYRITGNSTQLKGVEADVSLPGFYEHYKVREKDIETALDWDEIKSLSFSQHPLVTRLAGLKSEANEKFQADSTFIKIKRDLDWIAEKEKLFPLELGAFREDRETKKKLLADVKSLSVLRDTLVVKNTPEDAARIGAREVFRQEINKAWLGNLQQDRYLAAALDVLKAIKVEKAPARSSKVLTLNK